LGKSCAEADGQKLGHFANTTPVVQDVVAIIERHGEWREKQADQWLAGRQGQQGMKNSRPLVTPVAREPS